jgi:hypothetical protein
LKTIKPGGDLRWGMHLEFSVLARCHLDGTR